MQKNILTKMTVFFVRRKEIFQPVSETIIKNDDLQREWLEKGSG